MSAQSYNSTIISKPIIHINLILTTKIENILGDRRLYLLDHVISMGHQHTPQQAMYGKVPRFRRTRLSKDEWKGRVETDLRRLGLTWEEGETVVVKCGPVHSNKCGLNQGLSTGAATSSLKVSKNTKPDCCSILTGQTPFNLERQSSKYNANVTRS